MRNSQGARRRRAQTNSGLSIGPRAGIVVLPWLRRHGKRPVAFAAALLLGGAGLAACGTSGQTPGTHSQEGSGSGGSTSSTSNRAGSRIKPFAAVNFVNYLNGNDRMRVTVYDLRRHGQFVTLDFAFQCLNPIAGCSSGAAFESDSGQGADQITTDNDTASGISLVDSLTNKQYWPVRDAQNRPDSALLPDALVDSTVHLGWVTFPAPPASTASLDVLLPGSGPVIPGVPVGAGPAPTASQIGAHVQGASPAPFSQPAGGTTSGLMMPVRNLVLRSGNPAASDAESGNRATITLRSDVTFRFNKSNLTTSAIKTLAGVASQIKARATGPVQITGYTDSKGTSQVNIPLSTARARSVLAALKPATTGAPVSYQATGKGSSNPVAPNTKPDGSDNPAGRALNRRVTISFAVKAPPKPTPPAPASVAPPSAPAAGSGQTTTYTANDGGGDTSTYRVKLDRLFRSGDLAVLQLTATCEKGVTSTNACVSGNDFSSTGAPTVPPTTYDSQPHSSFTTRSALNSAGQSTYILALDAPTAVYLTDPTGRDYVPVTDPGGIPVTSVEDGTITQGGSFSITIYFQAPPSTVSTATVMMPGGSARIANVPIAASASS